MSESFRLSGDPSSIRGSAREWQAFSDAATTASGGITSLDTAEFVGDEADTYQDQINSDLPKHLRTASEAWGIVARALNTYAGELEDQQTRMSALATKAGNQQQSVSDRQAQVHNAQTADAAHVKSLALAEADLKPGQTLPPDTYQSQSSGAQSNLTAAQQALQSTYDAASKIRSEHAEAVQRCRHEIDRAKGLRFAKLPGFWGRLKDSVCGWISEHAGVLLQISSVLKTISGIAGLIALIPIPGLQEVAAGVALATGGAALLIDVGVKLATGKGSWTQIGLDALSMVPGGKAAMLAGAASTAYTGYEVSQGKASWSDLVMTAGMTALNMKHSGALDAVSNRVSYEAGAFRAGMKNAVEPVRGFAMAGGGEMPGGYRMSMSGFVQGRNNYVHDVYIDSARYPETAAHVTDAQNGEIWSGGEHAPGPEKPSELTIDRGGAGSRRNESLSDVPGKTGSDRDEYPPAMFSEGGSGASVKYISPSDNRGAGSAMGWQMRSAGLPNGARVRIVVR